MLGEVRRVLPTRERMASVSAKQVVSKARERGGLRVVVFCAGERLGVLGDALDA